MDADRREYLTALYAEGTISDDEAGDLLQTVSARAEARAELLEQATMARLLEHRLGGVNVEEKTDKVMASIAEWESRRGEMADRVMESLEFADDGRSPAKGRGWRRGAAMVAAAAAVVVAGWWIVSDQLSVVSDQSSAGAVIARVVEKAEGGRWRVEGGKWIDLKAGDEVREGMMVETGEGGRVKLAWVGEKTEVEVGERSTFNVQPSFAKVSEGTHSTLLGQGFGGQSSKGGKSLFLEKGRLAAVVAKQSGGARFAVRTPHAEVAVAGTAFSVGVSADGTRTRVDEGEVRMRPAGADGWEAIGRGASGLVKAGERRVRMPGRYLKVHKFRRLNIHDYGMSGVAFDGTHLWLYMRDGLEDSRVPTLCCVDPESGEVARSVALQEPVEGGGIMAWDGKHLWMTTSGPAVLAAVDPANGAVVRRLTVDTGKTPVNWRACDYGDGFFWVMGGGRRGEIWKVDSATGAVAGRIACEVSGRRAARLAWSKNRIYLGEDHGRRIWGIDPATGRVATAFDLPDLIAGGDMAMNDDGSMWITEWTRIKLLLVEVE